MGFGNIRKRERERERERERKRENVKKKGGKSLIEMRNLGKNERKHIA
jgi:hypothetical protein